MFGRKAKDLIESLQKDFPNLIYATNEEKPKRNSFEVILTLSDESSINIWSGIKLNPRKEKFPNYEHIKNEILKFNL